MRERAIWMLTQQRGGQRLCKPKKTYRNSIFGANLGGGERILFLKIMGLGSKFTIASTEINDLSPVEGVQFRPDRLYRLADGSYLDIEFDSTGDPENLLRYGVYSSLLRLKVYYRDREYCTVYTVVIYPYGVKLPTGVTLPPGAAAAEGDNHFQVTQVSIEDVVDGDKILADLRAKVELGHKPFESEEDVVKAALAPHGHVRGSHAELCRGLFSLISPSLAADNLHRMAVSLIATESNHIIGYPELKKLVEVTMSMRTVVDEMDELAGGHYAKLTRVLEQKDRKIAQLEDESKRSQAVAEQSLAEAEQYKSENAELKRKLALATASKGNGESGAPSDGGGS
jgi:Skp family chaperone for outer membrane proteins